MAGDVTYRVEDGVAVLTLSNPPVNALSQALRAGLLAGLERFAADATAQAAVLAGAGRNFIAGADIAEFGKPPLAPFLPDVVNAIEAQDKPVVAALSGPTLGGGLEVALAAHYRVAVPGATLGLPEVSLGILPGAGGTQRAPRLIGAEAALEMITSGKPVGAARAVEIGLVDALSDAADAESAGVAFARAVLAEGRGVRRVGALPAPQADDALFDAWREKLAARHRGQIAPLHCVEAVRAACRAPDIAAGMAEERRLFLELMDTPQRRALVHAFFAERRTAKPALIEGVAPRPCARLGVVGGGLMGAGIATSALLSGLTVALVERDEAAAAAARDRVAGLLAGAVKRGKLSEAARDAAMAERFSADAGDEGLAAADIAIEAIYEDLDAKRAVFARLDAVCREGAVLATNTSYLDINAIADATARPADVVGFHFFSPAHVMKLLEIVAAERSAPDAVATGFALAKRMKKIPVLAGVCDGFIGNRILAMTRAASEAMVLDGASPYAIDRALCDFGLAMGPFQVSDLAGLDIAFAARKRRVEAGTLPGRYPHFADALVARGWIGRKSGRGYYDYAENKAGAPDQEVEALIAESRAEPARDFPDDEIVARYMGAMVNEGARILGDGVAERPLDIDVALLHGYGFPRWRGGPMRYADEIGLNAVLADLRRFAEAAPDFWRPAPLLEDLAAKGAGFDSLNR